MAWSEEGRLWIGIMALSGAMLAGCVDKTLVQARPLAVPLMNIGWTYVDVPRQLLGPGSIVSIRDSDGVRYRGHIRDCVPITAVEIIGPMAVGIAGQIGTSVDISASALLGYHDIKIGAELKRVRKVTMEIGRTEEEAINEIKLMGWLNENMNAVSDTCLSYLRGQTDKEQQQLSDHIFILMDVLKITGYKYTFFDERGGKIDLRPPGMLTKYVSFEGNVAAQVDSSGALEVKEPLYIAFKKGVLVRVGAPLGASPEDFAADIMERRFGVLGP